MDLTEFLVRLFQYSLFGFDQLVDAWKDAKLMAKMLVLLISSDNYLELSAINLLNVSKISDHWQVFLL